MASVLALEVEKMIAQIDEIGPEIEGMRDIEHLHGAKEETIVAAQTAIRAFESRIDLLNKSIQANNALVVNGWDAIPGFEVSQVVLDDIGVNQATISLAKNRFHAPPLATHIESEVIISDQ